MDSSVYANKDFVAASKRWVNVYCSKDTSHGTERVNDQEMCKLHSTIKCEDHVSCNSEAGGKYFKGTFGAPATVWCMPDGKEIGQKQGGMASKQVIEKMAEAEKAVGPGLDSDSYEFLLEKIGGGDKAANDGKVKEAVEAYSAALKAMGRNPAAKSWVEKAQKGLDRQVELAKSRIEDAMKAKDEGDFAKAKELLKAIQTDFKGQPVAKEADKAMSDVSAAEKTAGKK
ncbi:MAG: hypothetical protein FD180_1890 [Planctomycetota bacterium]|nr:MAG: hypothetical protein FD180_1890 [Planctomycetota bacterium]